MSQLRNIAVLILASAFSMVGAGLLNPYLSIYFREQGISFIGLGAIFSAASVGSLLLRPFLGYISDIYGRKKLIVGFPFVVSLLTPLYVVIRNLTGLALVHASRSVATESPAPVISAMLADSAPKKWRATTFSVYSLVPSIVYAVALLGGGALLAWAPLLYLHTFLCFLL